MPAAKKSRPNNYFIAAVACILAALFIHVGTIFFVLMPMYDMVGSLETATEDRFVIEAKLDNTERLASYVSTLIRALSIAFIVLLICGGFASMNKKRNGQKLQN